MVSSRVYRLFVYRLLLIASLSQALIEEGLGCFDTWKQLYLFSFILCVFYRYFVAMVEVK